LSKTSAHNPLPGSRTLLRHRLRTRCAIAGSLLGCIDEQQQQQQQQYDTG